MASAATAVARRDKTSSEVEGKSCGRVESGSMDESSCRLLEQGYRENEHGFKNSGKDKV